MNYEVHHGGNSLNNVANLHVHRRHPQHRVLRGAAADGAQKYGLVHDITVGRDGLSTCSTNRASGPPSIFDLVESGKKLAVLS